MKKLIRRLGMRFVLAAILGSCWNWAIIRSQMNVGNWRGKGLWEVASSSRNRDDQCSLIPTPARKRKLYNHRLLVAKS
jgi:hypothetical protein